MNYKEEIIKLQKKNLEFLPFLTLKKDMELSFLKGKQLLEKELEVPFLLEDFIEDMKSIDINEGLNLKKMYKGMCFVLGVDPNFIYKSDYLNILNKSIPNLQAFIIDLINNNDNKLEYNVIYSLALVDIEESARNLFILANALENISLEYSAMKLEEKSMVFYNQAIKGYHDSHEKDELFSLSLYKLGYYYRNIGQYIRAKDYWERFIKIDKNDFRLEEIRSEFESLENLVDYEIGSGYVLSGKVEEGLDILLPLLDDYGSWWNLLFIIGLAFRQKMEFGIALNYFKQVLFINEDQIEALNELALCHLNLGQFTEAEAILDHAIILSDNDSELLSNRAVAKIYLNKLGEAQIDINNALKIKPDDEVALNIKNEIKLLLEK